MALLRHIHTNWTVCDFDSGTSLNPLLSSESRRMSMVVEWDMAEDPKRGIFDAWCLDGICSSRHLLLVTSLPPYGLYLSTFRIFSMIFHSRDFWLTEYLDYFAAGAVIFYTFYASLMLTLPFLQPSSKLLVFNSIYADTLPSLSVQIWHSGGLYCCMHGMCTICLVDPGLTMATTCSVVLDSPSWQR